MRQFEKTARSRANEAYQSSFHEFCRNNYLQNRKTSGLMLVLNEEQLVLLTKIIIGNKKQMRLNELFAEFEIRGVFMDNATKDCVVEFYEKLNLIEKKSDSGDAQYVKGIL
jgi:DNA phosphorothioation-dependent restriction protein DptG